LHIDLPGQANTLNKTFKLSQAYTAKSYIVAGKLFQNLTNGYGKVAAYELR